MKNLIALIIPVILAACGGSPEYYTRDGSDVKMTAREAELIKECLPGATSNWPTGSKAKTGLFSRESKGFHLWVTDAALKVRYIEDADTGKKRIVPSTSPETRSPDRNQGSCHIENDKLEFFVSNQKLTFVK